MQLDKCVVTCYPKNSELELEVDYEYVMACSVSNDESYTAIGLSNQMIQVRDLHRLQLVSSSTNSHHSTINTIKCSKRNTNMFISGSSDGYLKIWDNRIPQCASEIVLSAPVWSFDMDHVEHTIASGTNDKVLFCDIRTGKMIGEYGESHVDAVTQVLFHPVCHQYVVTASEDGVVSMFNTQIASEEDAIESCFTVESAVTKLTLFGPKFENIAILTGTETLSLWNIMNANHLASYPNIRHQHGVSLDYLVDTIYDGTSLHLYAGTHQGDLYSFQLDHQQVRLVDKFSAGHKACVRTITPTLNGMLTGGEDARICHWRNKVCASPPISNAHKIASQSKSFRASPY